MVLVELEHLGIPFKQPQVLLIGTNCQFDHKIRCLHTYNWIRVMLIFMTENGEFLFMMTRNCLNCSSYPLPWLNLHGLLFSTEGICLGKSFWILIQLLSQN